MKATIIVKGKAYASLDSKIEQLVGEITTHETDLKAAIEICAKRASDFAALEKELKEVIETLNCRIGLLERHASMLELKNENSVEQALDVLVQVSTLSSADANR